MAVCPWRLNSLVRVGGHVHIAFGASDDHEPDGLIVDEIVACERAGAC
jgi:hypothetical protein